MGNRLRHPRWWVVIGGVLVLAIVATTLYLSGGSPDSEPTHGSSPHPTAMPTGTLGPALSSKLVPSHGALFGAFVDRRDGQTHEQAIEQMESSLGRRLDIDREYYAWDDPIPTVQEATDVAMGRITLMSWKAETRDRRIIPWASIASGAEDAWIIRRADAFKAFGHPVMLVFHHEPENDVATNGTPQEFAAAWRHVHDVFVRRGATNVIWVLVLFAFTYSGRQVADFYPGDRYLDWVGGDGYNFWGTLPGPGRCSRDRRGRWRSLAEVFSATVAFANAHAKPAIAAEWGTTEDPAVSGRKAAWFVQARVLVESWPTLKALVYFDADRTSYSGCDWTPQTSETSWDAFRALALDPYVNVLGAGP